MFCFVPENGALQERVQEAGSVWGRVRKAVLEDGGTGAPCRAPHARVQQLLGSLGALKPVFDTSGPTAGHAGLGGGSAGSEGRSPAETRKGPPKKPIGWVPDLAGSDVWQDIDLLG
jgi:hypothetical protein